MNKSCCGKVVTSNMSVNKSHQKNIEKKIEMLRSKTYVRFFFRVFL